MAKPIASRIKLTREAIRDLERLGINPMEGMAEQIQELKKLKEMSIEAFKGMRGYSEKYDAGTMYLANAIKAVTDTAEIYNKLAKYRYPTLSAIALKDLNGDDEDRQPMTTLEAVNVLKADPFAPKELKELPAERIVQAMESNISTPFLPSGKPEK